MELVHTTRTNIAEKIHIMIQNLCQKYGCFYADNTNIRGNHLYKDDFNIKEKGKIVLARILIFFLNKAKYFLDYNFFDKQTYHPLVKI